MPVGVHVPNCPLREPHFYHKLFIPGHPLHQSGIFLMVILTRKECHCNKNEKKTDEWLVFYEDLSHFPMIFTTLGFTCTMCA